MASVASASTSHIRGSVVMWGIVGLAGNAEEFHRRGIKLHSGEDAPPKTAAVEPDHTIVVPQPER